MQTFLVNNDLDFATTMRCLDDKRLGKQRVEAMQILNVLTKQHKPENTRAVGWVNHPAVLMWRGYEDVLRLYHDVAIYEWKLRGFRNTMSYLTSGQLEPWMVHPPWFNNEAIFASHRSNLLRKMPQHYSQFGWSEPDNLPYVWPTKKDGK